MHEVAAVATPTSSLKRHVSVACAGFAGLYAVASLATGQENAWLGDLAQLIPPLAFIVLAIKLARRSTAQVRAFWNLNAAHCVMWVIGQCVWTYLDVTRGGIPNFSPTDPIFFAASVPLAAALYGRPDRDRPRWLFDIVVLDIVLIALFAGFMYVFFIVTLAVTAGSDEVYDAQLTHLFNVRNFILAAWSGWVWRTASSPRWRRMLGLYCAALTATFVGGVIYDPAIRSNSYATGSLWDLSLMVPYGFLALAAAYAYEDGLFTPAEQAEPTARLPMISLFAVALLVLIPITDEIARRVFDVPRVTEDLRTRLALTMMIPFGVVVVVREFLSRRALLTAGRDLVSTREELAQKEKLAAVGQLVSGVAHELNNPLQGVLGYAELLAQTNTGERDSAELRAIRQNASRAAGIVRNLLTFAGRETTVRSWQNVNGIVQAAVDKCAPMLHQSGTHLRLNPADRLPLIYLDDQRFEQVLVNLIENAESAIEARRTDQTAHLHQGEISIETRSIASPDRIVIQVSDNGPGVRDEDLPKLFEPFFTTRTTGQGTGLGLSVCYGIVREHGGTIQAQNRSVGGAMFTVELPVIAATDVSEEEPFDAEPIAEPGTAPDDDHVEIPPPVVARVARALVVDDEESNAALVRRALDQAGYEVESTTLSRRALVMIERTAYDVIIADVKMPELSGQELYTRACQIRPEVARRFIFITGDIDGEDTLKFLEHSRCGYFMKPFNLERLTTAVDVLVSGGRASARIG